jgi:hypothetical protein
MMRTLILISLLMAPLPMQAQTFEFGRVDCASIHTVAASIAGNCALPACTKKSWAKVAGAIAAATGNSVPEASAATIPVTTKSNKASTRTEKLAAELTAGGRARQDRDESI